MSKSVTSGTVFAELLLQIETFGLDVFLCLDLLQLADDLVSRRYRSRQTFQRILNVSICNSKRDFGAQDVTDLD